MDPWEAAEDAVRSIRDVTPAEPAVALILGSGLGGLAGEVADRFVIPYADISHFPISTAPGHRGELVLGTLQGTPVVTFNGRVHMYEGYEPWQVAFPVRVARLLGARLLIVTNAAGAVNTAFRAGELMLIADHLNLTGRNPLVGPNDLRFGLRFPDMTEAYDARLRDLALQVAAAQGIALQQGVYAGLLGPTYETPAEVRMLRTLGADAVGMSTVTEVIAARHMGMEVLGISCLANMAAGILPQPLTEEEVIETGRAVAPAFAALIRGVLARLVETSQKGQSQTT